MTLYLTHPEFDCDGISYGFFGRKGGVSTGIFSSLNVGLGSNDERENVLKNRDIIKESLGLKNLSTLYQIHSDICHVIDKPIDDPIEADALVTLTPGVAIGVLSADCGPILFRGQSTSGQSIIGAAHAGWGGAFKGILESTLDKMEEMGAVRSNIVTMVGPCIGLESYEVSPDFLKPFLERDADANKFFTPQGEKFLFNLPAYIEFRLRAAGVNHVVQSGKDTCKLDQEYFSYRRKTHAGEPDYGRQISLICID